MTEKTMLIIEDDPTMLRGLRDNFQSEAYHVMTASDGEAGLTAALNGSPDLILLDIMLPDIDGFDVLETLKSSPETKKIPVIIMSNLGQPEDKKQGKALGAQNYIVKSDLSLDDVVKKVRELLPPL